MPPTEKGLVGSIAGEERVLDSRESKITRSPRQHARGASSTYCWSSVNARWRLCQSTTKCTPSQRERQFAGPKCEDLCARVRLLIDFTLSDLDIVGLRCISFFLDWCVFLLLFIFVSYVSCRSLVCSCMLCAHKPKRPPSSHHKILSSSSHPYPSRDLAFVP